VTSKIDLSGVLDYSTWYYLGDPGFVTGGTQGRVDRVRSLGAALSYKPIESITLQLSAQHESRSSNLDTANYTANVASLAARFAF
jgi:hypothetical protein